MTTRILLFLILGFSYVMAAESAPEDLLRQGLFEEEANHDFDKAAESYRAVIAAHDRQRSLAATATFRLGEIARKKNDTEAAAAAFRTVIERFPEQEDLARLSRENLAALGMAPAAIANTEPQTSGPEDAEIARLQVIARNSPDLLDGANPDGWRPIHTAAREGWAKVISYLLENKAKPDGRTIKEEFTPLQLAAIHGHLSAVKVLLAAKADINATFRIERSRDSLPTKDRKADKIKGAWTALDLAVLYNRREIASALIEAGADIQRTGPVLENHSPNPLTTLLLAIYIQRNELAMDLVRAGAPLGVTSSTTPLNMAVSYDPELVAPLLKAGADPKLAAESGYTALHVAAYRSVDIAKRLIDAGADVKAADSSGNTPLHFARNLEMVDLLISKGADPNARSKDGETLLKWIVRSESPAVFEALLQHGAVVADAKALLRSTPESMLPLVREKVVYPKEQRPDAILLSIDGNTSPRTGWTPEVMSTPRQPGAPPQPRVVSQSKKTPDIITVETRSSADSPPPSLPEALFESLYGEILIKNIRVVRGDASSRFETLLDWSPVEGAPIPTDWPALEWGDILEFSSSRNGYTAGNGPPSVGDLAEQIPSRTITVSLGGIGFQTQIPGSGRFFLDGNWGDRREEMFLPNMERLVDFSQVTILRKGAKKPITVDFSKQPGARIRLLDGDTVEMAFDLKKLDEFYGVDDSINIIPISADGSPTGTSGQTSVIGILSGLNGNGLPKNVDFSNIAILRRSAHWKPEQLDLTAWLDSLPKSEKWKWNYEDLAVPVPKADPGDVVILFENPEENAVRDANEIRKKIKEVESYINPRPLRPRVNPPPAE